MALSAFLVDAPPGERRRTDRRTLRFETSASSAGRCDPVILHDIAAEGMLMQTAAILAVGDRLEVALPSGTVHAEVVWKGGQLRGCRFSSPLSKAQLSSVLLRADPAAPAAPEAPGQGLSEALLRLQDLEEEVSQLRNKVETRLAALAGPLPVASYPGAPSSTVDDPEESPDEDTRFSFAVRFRVILGAAVCLWALILWGIGLI